MAALNRVLRGWAAYYRHVNAKAVLTSLDFWVGWRLEHWLCEKHKCGIRQVLREYQHQQGERKNLAVKDSRGRLLFLYRMGDLPLTRYPFQKRSNPYLKEESTIVTEAEVPMPDSVWNGGSRVSPWRDTRQFVLERDGYRCQNPTCGATFNLDVHHKRWHKNGGDDDPTNLTTLCRQCHKLEQQKLLLVNW